MGREALCSNWKEGRVRKTETFLASIFLISIILSRVKPGQTRQFIVSMQMSLSPGARVGQSVHCDVCIRLEMLMLC